MQRTEMYKSKEAVVLVGVFKAQCNKTGSYSDHKGDIIMIFLGVWGQFHRACAFNTLWIVT